MNPCLAARVIQAVELYKFRLAPKIIFSGGDDIEDGVNEAETMKKYAISLGVIPEDVLLEKSATSTYENLLFSEKILRQNNLDRLIIVTDPFHLARASLVANKLGIKHSLSSVEDSPCWTNHKYISTYFLKEPIVIILYKLQGKI